MASQSAASSEPLGLHQDDEMMQDDAAGGASPGSRVQPTASLPPVSLQQTDSRMQSVGSPGRSFGGVAPSGTTMTPALGGRSALGHTTPLLRVPAGRAGPSELNTSDAPIDYSTDDGGADGTMYIWGTNVSIATVRRCFRRFIRTFSEPQEDMPKYMQLLQQAIEFMEMAINIDGVDLASFDAGLYSQVVNYPKDVIPILDDELRELAIDTLGFDRADVPVSLMVRLYNLTDRRSIRELDPTDIDKLVSVSGMVTRTSNIIPEMRGALYECEHCKNDEYVVNVRGQIVEPESCSGCSQKFSMRLIHNRSLFDNKQLVKLQESPNEVPEGETPQALSLFAFDELTDFAKPGDRITVTGVYRAAPIRAAPRANRRELKAIYKTHIDIVHIRREEHGRLFTVFGDGGKEQTPSSGSQQGSQGTAGERCTQEGDGEEGLQIMDNSLQQQVRAKEQALKELARDPQIYEKLVASLAPSIWQMDDVKKGVLCQLFGGVSKNVSGSRTRGDIHVLLVGDPGVSKSQLLTYVHKLAPRGIYTSGRGSSAVGLTAYVSKDPETRDMVLESGALVLSDQGICCIDEFDKMSDSARSMLHEVMEQQTVSVAKAGIIATLNARTSVLASANPVQSRYNPRLSVIENIMLPPTLLSRFDLIYLVLDKADEARDRRLAKHLVSLHGDRAEATQQPPIPLETLREYVAYARTKCQPVLSDDAVKGLVDGYLDMRRMGSSRNVISATARQLESLLRLSEALARMKLAEYVTGEDVAEAIRLMRVATMQSAIDASTGLIDMEAITTGVTMGQRAARAQLAEEIKKLLSGRQGGVSVLELVQMLQGQSSVRVVEKDVKAALTSMSDVVDWNRDTGRVLIA